MLTINYFIPRGVSNKELDPSEEEDEEEMYTLNESLGSSFSTESLTELERSADKPLLR